ncbi:ankyrin repeat/DNA polymerase domain-containing protein [Bodo saltans virus]|uniref:Ankyrin repeat/DNA polymerase domain-containing protein n=1 Tax=Bodo saltans virus TaxID=2024608 RepID=A0A2H4UTD5_9VIRU|nr:ankyrin repeat/DNA polymerase domain-containing protein [Bodo saltans virus]ATZ80107.1 ankyrin repeat/DNA polymerase domain-containing protein [Bodo saltans virus]
MLANWIIHTQVYDNIKKEKLLDDTKLNSIIEKVINFPFNDCLNDLIIDEKIEILFKNPKICRIFESIKFNEDKIASIRKKFMNLAMRNNYEFDDSYKNEYGELYDFYKNMVSITCSGEIYIGKICKKCNENCTIAAKNGHLICLKYAYINGCLWDTETCKSAAENGNLECLQYAHENGCPWDENTCIHAAQNGHLECLKYAHENGCPCDMIYI